VADVGWGGVSLLLEIDPAYADVILRRWQEVTGEDRVFADIAAARAAIDHGVIQTAES
jgi:hypothetical protein